MVEEINLCFDHGGGWNHYTNQCVLKYDYVISEYAKAREAAESKENFLSSAPKKKNQDCNAFEGKKLNWSNYHNWSPEYQLCFSSFNSR